MRYRTRSPLRFPQYPRGAPLNLAPRRIAVVALSLLGLSSVLVAAWLAWQSLSYKARADAVRAALESVEGVRVIELWGNEDITLENIYAQIEVSRTGRDPLEIGLRDLHPQAVHRGPILLSSLGSYRFRIQGHRSIGDALPLARDPERGRIISRYEGGEGPFPYTIHDFFGELPACDTVRELIAASDELEARFANAAHGPITVSRGGSEFTLTLVHE